MKEYEEDAPMMIDYDKDSGSLFMGIPEREEGDYAYSKTYSGGTIIVDFDAEGHFLGIEILDADRLLK